MAPSEKEREKQQFILNAYARLLQEKVIEERLCRAAALLPHAKVFSAGRSAQGRPLLCLSAGHSEEKVFYLGGVHGLEGVTSLLLLKFLENLALATSEDRLFFGLPKRTYWQRVGLVVMPLANPDGVAMARPFWQANSRGVDINHNFDADWEACHALEEEMGITAPCGSKYGGKKPFSENESRAIAKLCKKKKFLRMMAFHSQGEEIYAGHGEKCDEATLSLGKLMERLTGYTLCQPTTSASHGGAKDWFYDTFRLPAYTLEVGRGENPLPPEDADEIYKDLEKLLTLFPLL